MFVCYVPDERASLCYAVGVLSSPAKIPGCVVKVKPKRLRAEHERGCVFAGFQYVCKFLNDMSAPQQDLRVQVSRSPCVYCTCLSVFVFHFSTKRVYVFRISCKDLKSMLSQVNYRVPNMRFLREKLPVTSSYLSQNPFPLHLPAHFPFNMMPLDAKDL